MTGQYERLRAETPSIATLDRPGFDYSMPAVTINRRLLLADVQENVSGRQMRFTKVDNGVSSQAESEVAMREVRVRP